MKITRMRSCRTGVALLSAASLIALAGCSGTPNGDAGGGDDEVTIGIVELNLSNPFFSTLQKATEAAAVENGWKVMKAEARVPGDAATQVTAIENMINSGVEAIVLDPANPTALVDVVGKARDAGILVITVNATLDPVDAADATFATDNVAAGELIGEWAAKAGPADPQIAMLDFDLSDGPAKGRHDGFLQGYGIDDSSDLIVGTALTQGTIETGQNEMEKLLSAHPGIDLVYTINEPTARGAHNAITSISDDDVTIVSVDGACTGVEDVRDGVIGATAMQFPSRMGQLAVDAIAKFLEDGTKPPAGLNDSGVQLITDNPVDGIESEDSAWGLENCWGGE